MCVCVTFCAFQCRRFPKDEALKQKWIRATRREDFVPTKYSRLCSLHFSEEDIDRTSLSRVRIRGGAVPSVFEAFPVHLQPKNSTKRKPPQERNVSESQSVNTIQPQVSDQLCEEPTNNPELQEAVSLKRKLEETKKSLVSSKKKIKVLQQSRRRLLKKNADLQNVVTELRRKSLICEESINVLQNCAGGVSDLLKRQIAKHNGKPGVVKYSPQLRSFALTLNFYSPRAYRFVRKSFDTSLPHPRTLEKWLKCVDVKPGFTEPSFSALKARADASALHGKPVLCALMMDEMSIRQHVEWDGSKFQGFIDMGTELDDDQLPVAKEALTFMAVALDGSFKLPVGYFLIAGLGASERSSLVQQCIDKLHSVGVTVVSLTLDGAAANMSMLTMFGCSFQYDNIKSTFSHPLTSKEIGVFLDPCHMLKLVRNSFADKKSLVNGQGNKIRWDYIDNLHKLQTSQGLHFGNKLRTAHIEWFKRKMNVKLAAQLLSESVATSLQFCLDEKLSDFKGCEATIEFIKIFNNLFDVLNSRNLCSSGFKRPISEKNSSEIISFLEEAETYIKNLKLTDGLHVIKSNRRTGFLGFIFCIQSLLHTYKSFIACSDPQLSYITTYKMSQDHIELFFGKIRSMGGCNNNPTSKQFSCAYKKLLVHNDIQDVLRGNCLPLDSVPALSVSSHYLNDRDIVTPSVHAINTTFTKARILTDDFESTSADTEQSTCISDSQTLTSPESNIVAYIAGFVVFKLKKSIRCEACRSALETTATSWMHSLINVKSKGGLTMPSTDVIGICMSSEKLFRAKVSNVKESHLTLSPRQCDELVYSVLSGYTTKAVFPQLNKHMLETGPLENHVLFLIKAVAEKYLQIRHYYAGKEFTSKLRSLNKMKSRQTYNKLVLFSGQ